MHTFVKQSVTEAPQPCHLHRLRPVLQRPLSPAFFPHAVIGVCLFSFGFFSSSVLFCCAADYFFYVGFFFFFFCMCYLHLRSSSHKSGGRRQAARDRGKTMRRLRGRPKVSSGKERCSHPAILLPQGSGPGLPGKERAGEERGASCLSGSPCVCMLPCSR